MVLLAAWAALAPGSEAHQAANETAKETANETASTTADKLAHHRNLGKAFYENPATQHQAPEEFRQALALAPGSARDRVNLGLALLRSGQEEAGVAELEKGQKADPSIPHTWFNLGIAYKRMARYPEAITQLEGMLERVPDDPITHYNLGVLYKLQGRAEDAVAMFEKASRLDPDLAGPYFQLATAYRQARRPEEAKEALARFRENKARQAAADTTEDLEWNFYAEIYEPYVPSPGIEPRARINFEPRSPEGTVGELDAATAGTLVLDADGDGGADLLAWSSRGVVLLIDGTQAAKAGLDNLRGVVDVAAGDLDDDALADLAVVTREGVSLLRNTGGRFTPLARELPRGPFATAVWLDFDHDYDLDLFLLGATCHLMRNEGASGFRDVSREFPFVRGRAVAATRLDMAADTQGMDLAVAYADRPGALYRDRLAGRYQAETLDGLSALEGARPAIVAQDLDSDGWTDLAAGDGQHLILLRNTQRGGFWPRAAPSGARSPFLFADFEGRGADELVAAGKVHRKLRDGGFGSGEESPGLDGAVALAAADFDRDGKIDLAAVSGDGGLELLANRTNSRNHWLGVELAGKRNLKLAPGSEVEVKAGSFYQKKIYRGVPLVFGLGGHEIADTLRITWPNGLIQNETERAAGAWHAVEEEQRLSGSCPTVFVWNGREHEFIGDILAAAPLGVAAGEGKHFPPRHYEYLQIPQGSLVTRDGFYELRITEELREAAFFDQIRLLAIDHPERIDIFHSDKFTAPPYPEFRLYGVDRRIYPRAARDHRGRDVRDRLLRRDAVYPDQFERGPAAIAEIHHLELELGDVAAVAAGGGALLVLHGWVDWADGSTLRRVDQEGDPGLVPPYLQVRGADGQWRTVVADMGVPAGRPKTIVVELPKDALPAEGELAVRIVTNFSLYWDEIFVTPGTAPPDVQLSELGPARAELRYAGFSRVVTHPERKQPELFVYADRDQLAMWNPIPGRYTRYGHVEELLSEIDDRFAIMGAGDEIALRFDPAALPPLPEGFERSFILFADGWIKDADANGAFSQTVGPLPYHEMPDYPYASPHSYPDDDVHTLYRERYNTRQALRLIRPLAGATRR